MPVPRFLWPGHWGKLPSPAVSPDVLTEQGKGTIYMKTKQQPLISIGMIFRDDIRSIERCLKALQPLRDAVPCELVMADTGSEDGSRIIAEKYADILIDFEWINDFSAARNAVMDECSGKWHLTIDTDEYLREDSDFKQLTDFLDCADIQGFNLATMTIRNHSTYEMDGEYTDFMGVRLLRMSTGIRYQGELHERWSLPAEQFKMMALSGIVFDHDGYVEMGTNSEKGKKKRERNVKLLRQKIQQDPKVLLTRLQFIESGGLEEDFMDQLRHAVRMVKRKVPTWETFGPPIIRHAVYTADARSLPEFDEWVELAYKMFPESMYTRLDVEYAMFARSWNDSNYADCVERGERYLLAMEDFRAGKDPTARVFSVLKMATSFQEQGVKIVLASACAYEGKLERALELLGGIEYVTLSGKQTMDILKSAQEIHFRSNLDTAPLITAIWEGINEPKPSQKQADHRKAVFNMITKLAFAPENQKRERENKAFCRCGYTLYLPLKGKSEIGNAAGIMELEDTASLTAALQEVEDWDVLPIEALAHALDHRTQFPLPGKPMPIEEMEGLAKRLAKDDEAFYSIVLQSSDPIPADWQRLTWIRGLVIGAVRVFGWEKKTDVMTDTEADRHRELGLAIAECFARVERAFISRYYTADTWTEENIYVLPPMHRFGWYCAKAFAALDSGDITDCLQQLRAGLASYKDIAKMVEFLLDQVSEREKAARITTAPPELIELARQVKAMLARFDPDDPAVEELKNSPAYQQVSWMIDEPATIFGRLPQ